jgi:hypothetical protein
MKQIKLRIRNISEPLPIRIAPPEVGCVDTNWNYDFSIHVLSYFKCK